MTPMNWVIAPNVVCCGALPTSPESCASPEGPSPPNAIGIVPLVLKKLMIALPTFC